MSLNFKLREKDLSLFKGGTNIFDGLGKTITIVRDPLFRTRETNTFIKSYIYHAVKL